MTLEYAQERCDAYWRALTNILMMTDGQNSKEAKELLRDIRLEAFKAIRPPLVKE